MLEDEMSDTPRTDAVVVPGLDLADAHDIVDLCRQLERELSQATKPMAPRHIPPRAFAEMVLKHPLAIGIPVYYSEWPTPDGPASYDADH